MNINKFSSQNYNNQPYISVPFKLILPKHLPCSFNFRWTSSTGKNNHCKIEYYLEAKLTLDNIQVISPQEVLTKRLVISNNNTALPTEVNDRHKHLIAQESHKLILKKRDITPIKNNLLSCCCKNNRI